MDALCSGRRKCSLRIPDQALDVTKPCPKEFKTFLQAKYGCVTGESFLPPVNEVEGRQCFHMRTCHSVHREMSTSTGGGASTGKWGHPQRGLHPEEGDNMCLVPVVPLEESHYITIIFGQNHCPLPLLT